MFFFFGPLHQTIQKKNNKKIFNPSLSNYFFSLFVHPFHPNNNTTNNSGLQDIRDSLAETSYGRFLADHAGKLEVSIITDKMNDKLASEFYYIRCLAGPILAKFMDFITYEYMIENVMLILKAASTGRTDVADIMEQCHPLGRFDESIMRSIASFENTPAGHQDLYRCVLVETPIGKYFERYLIETKEDARRQNAEERQQILNDESTTILESWLTKLYLEDFYHFCREVGGDTALVMCEILETRADTTAISITLNSFNTPLNEPKHLQDRADLYPSFGKLYAYGVGSVEPGRQENAWDLVNVTDFEGLKRCLAANHPNWRGALDGDAEWTETCYKREVMLGELAFEGQFSFGCFYAYVKLKEQEIRNVQWISDVTILGRPELMKENFIPIFDPASPWRTGAMSEAYERRHTGY